MTRSQEKRWVCAQCGVDSPEPGFKSHAIDCPALRQEKLFRGSAAAEGEAPEAKPERMTLSGIGKPSSGANNPEGDSWT